MSYFVRKGKKRQVYVYTFKAGKLVPLPRSETRHLDSQTDAFIKSWLAERQRATRQRDVLAEHATFGRLEGLVQGYCEFMKGKGKDPITVDQHRAHLLRNVLPFFLSVGCTDPGTRP